MADAAKVDQSVIIKFAQKLAGNEKKFRDRALKKLRKWLETRSQTGKGAFTEDDFLKIWKGLHYCMWMADKPLVQEELANSLAELVHCFGRPEQAFLFIDVFFQTEAREWYGIDRLRLDKFMMLVRRVLAESFRLIARHNWKAKHIKRLAGILNKGVASSNTNTPDGLKYHVADIYLQELEKVGANEIKAKQLELFLEPFIQLIVHTKNPTLMRHVLKRVFLHIMDYEVERIVQKKKEDGTMDSEEEDDDEMTEQSEEEGDEKFYPMNVNLERLADRLFELASSDECVGKNRNDIYKVVQTYKDLAAGILPKEETFDIEDEEESSDIDIEASTRRLQQFEEKLLKKTGKKRKKKQQTSEEKVGPPEKKRKKEKQAEDEPKIVNKSKNKFKSDGEEKKKKKGKEKMEKKKKKEKKVAKPKVGNESMLFSGGFVDEDDNVTPTTSSLVTSQPEYVIQQTDGSTECRSAKELCDPLASSDVVHDVSVMNKNVRRKSLDETALTRKDKYSTIGKKKAKRRSEGDFTGISIIDKDAVAMVMCNNSIEDNDSSLTMSNQNDTQVLIKGKKKKKRQSFGDVEEELSQAKSREKVGKANKKVKRRKSFGFCLDSTEDNEEVFSPLEKSELPAKNKKKKAKLPETNEGGEIEIWVPSKKYDGKLKGWFAEQEESSLSESSTSGSSDKPLISFQAIKKTPPAFVRRAMKKTTPQTEPRKLKSKLSHLGTPGLTPGSAKKRVSFIMSMNQSQDYTSLSLSPAQQFNPESKPGHPIIRTPTSTNTTPTSAFRLTKRQTKINTVLNTLTRKKKGATPRSRASDFF